MTYLTIRYEVSENIATITLDRPSVMNAFNHQMLRELHEALDATDADDTVRAVIFTGAGRAFCAGADLSSGAKTFDYSARLAQRGVENEGVNWNDPGIRDTGGTLTLRLFRCIKPLICAGNGVAVGIGITMQLPMDVRIASENARFGFVFARRGIVPEAASSWFLPRLVGMSQALDWCYSGRVFDAEEALRGGLISEVLPPDALMARAREIAKSYMSDTAPVSIALIRQMMWRGLTQSHPMEAHRVDSRLVYACGQSGDVREGVSAFLEKRKAAFPCKVSQDMPAGCYPWWVEPEY
jgi:enoyl-CoA hydratase/carnithine racemase